MRRSEEPRSGRGETRALEKRNAGVKRSYPSRLSPRDDARHRACLLTAAVFFSKEEVKSRENVQFDTERVREKDAFARRDLGAKGRKTFYAGAFK